MCFGLRLNRLTKLSFHSLTAFFYSDVICYVVLFVDLEFLLGRGPCLRGLEVSLQATDGWWYRHFPAGVISAPGDREHFYFFALVCTSLFFFRPEGECPAYRILFMSFFFICHRWWVCVCVYLVVLSRPCTEVCGTGVRLCVWAGAYNPGKALAARIL